jgi:hypothetical protein
MPLGQGAEECGVAIPMNATLGEGRTWVLVRLVAAFERSQSCLLDVSSGDRRVNVFAETMTDRQAHVTLLT